MRRGTGQGRAWRAALAMTLALGLAAGCRDPVAPAQTIYVVLETVPSPFGGMMPIAAPPRAVTVRFIGKQSGLEAVTTGTLVLAGPAAPDSVSAVVIAPVGQALVGGVIKVRVPNAGQALQADTVRLLQAAASDYSLISAQSYVVKLQAQLP